MKNPHTDKMPIIRRKTVIQSVIGQNNFVCIYYILKYTNANYLQKSNNKQSFILNYICNTRKNI